MLSLICFVLAELGQWKYFQKMGREGWEGIIPLYNLYVLFNELYGNGWKCLLLLIPIYNIYVIIKMYIDLAHAFNKGTGFGVGLTLLPFIFTLLLAFGDATYKDGSMSKISNDALSRGLDSISSKLNNGVSSTTPKKDPDALKKLKELDELHKSGILTDEEFNEKKEDLIKRI